MNETKKTLIFAGSAIVLMLLAFITAPSRVTPDAFLDKDELFFPDFTDPNAATTLEVIKYDDETGAALPFKVTYQNGVWTIPSHHDYPADGKDRLANTAAGVIGIKKDEFRSDNVSDHAALGVIDPLDETNTSLEGRGTRITIKGENDQILADFIVSEEIEGRENFRFVRIPEQKRVYAARMDLDLSTTFNDWIEKDLLLVEKDEIEEVVLKDYSIDERTGSVQQRDVLELSKDNGTWRANKMSSKQEVNTTKMNDLLRALDELTIVGVRPKPPGLSESLTRAGDGIKITQEDMLSLQSKGYYFSRDGQLLSNEGELEARTEDGITFTLRFGEVVVGSGLEVTAGVESDESRESPDEDGENRYLFITTSLDESNYPEPAKPRNADFKTKADSLWTDSDRENNRLQEIWDEWDEQLTKARERNEDLNQRFARWYYVISSSSFDKLDMQRDDILKEKSDT